MFKYFTTVYKDGKEWYCERWHLPKISRSYHPQLFSSFLPYPYLLKIWLSKKRETVQAKGHYVKIKIQPSPRQPPHPPPPLPHAWTTHKYCKIHLAAFLTLHGWSLRVNRSAVVVCWSSIGKIFVNGASLEIGQLFTQGGGIVYFGHISNYIRALQTKRFLLRFSALNLH